jgi:hypothetical protein
MPECYFNTFLNGKSACVANDIMKLLNFVHFLMPTKCRQRDTELADKVK